MIPLMVVAILLGLEATDIDRVLESRFYDPQSGGFPLRYNTFLEVVLHYWTKYVVALIGCAGLAGCLLAGWVPSLRPARRLMLFVALGIGLSTAAVSSAKFLSGKHCPWDLSEYGGELTYTRLLEKQPPSSSPGRCFPAGHASTGFSLLTFYFAGRALRDARLARAGLILGMTAGLVLGFGRMLQGAHFLTHVLWSGLLCWLVILALYTALMLRAAPSTAAAD